MYWEQPEVMRFFRRLSRADPVRRYNEFAKRYASSVVPAEIIYQAFAEIVRPETLGFTEIRRGTYAKPASTDIFHMLSLQAYKGRDYGLRWGVSLTYVPHSWDDKLSWHRTLKSSRYDLFEEPPSYPPLQRSDIEELMAPSLFGEECLRNELSRIWSVAGPEVQQWFSTTTTLDHVLQRAYEQMRRHWELKHFPDPALVHLLTLARLGDPETALSKLGALSKGPDGESLNIGQLSKAILLAAEAVQ